MLRSQIPAKIGVSFASGAQTGFIQNPLPVSAQPNGRASFTTGFSELNFDPLASGGIPPWGKDFNGLMFAITEWLRFAAAGGLPVSYDAAFAATIGGYPQYALIQAATGDRYWLSTADNNLTDPDAGGAGWIRFPDVIVQKQAGNYNVDIGAANAYRVTLTPLPASLAAIVGSPIRFLAAAPNTIVNPTMLIDNVAGDLAIPMINSNGNVLLIGQISRAGQICEGFVDNVGKFQLTSPPPIPPSGAALVTGMIYCWSMETAPAGTLECNGATYAIVTYPALFNVIGNRYGGDGVSNFKVPDLRGAFIRGWDHGRGLDPDASARTNSGNGTLGDHVGTWQNFAIGPVSLPGRIRFPRIGIDAWSGHDNITGLNWNLPAIDEPLSLQGNAYTVALMNYGYVPSGGNIFTGTNYGHVTGSPINVMDPNTPSNPAGSPRSMGANLIYGEYNIWQADPNYNVTQPPWTSDQAYTVSQIAGTIQLDGVDGNDTRPVNIYEMFVIAY